MANRKSIAEKLTKKQAQDIIHYFKIHTFCSTMRKFKLTRSALTILFNKYGVLQHSNSEAEVFKHLEADGYDLYSTEQIKSIYLAYLNLKNIKDVCIECHIKEYFLIYLLTIKNIKINYQQAINKNWYNNITDQQKKEIVSYYLIPNTITSTANEFGLTPYCISYILNKNNIAKHDIILADKLGKQKQKQKLSAKYGCNITNVFQLDTTKEKISQTKKQRYNNDTYTNRVKAKQTCLIKYGANTFLGSEAGIKEIKKYSQEHYGTDFAFLSTSWQNNKAKISKALEAKKNKKYVPENYSVKYLSLVNNIAALTNYVVGKTIYEIASDLSISRDHAYYLLAKNNLLDYVNKISAHSH